MIVVLFLDDKVIVVAMVAVVHLLVPARTEDANCDERDAKDDADEQSADGSTAMAATRADDGRRVVRGGRIIATVPSADVHVSA